jgi:glycosyltransferase involved in cell wall biosynthesis
MAIIPLVSIVTPVLNPGPDLLEATIRSVESQTYPNIEFIIVDGGSTDGSISVLKRNESKLKWISEKDSGQSDALAKGFRWSKGAILTWINADDLLEPWAVSRAVELLQSNSDVSLIYGDIIYIDQAGAVIEKHEQPDQLCIKSLILGDQYLVQPGTFFRRKVYDEIGEVNLSLDYVMDYELWIRILPLSGSKREAQVLARHRMTSTNKTIASSHRFWPEICQVIEELERHLPPGLSERDRVEGLSRARLRAGLELCRVGKTFEGIPYIIKALENNYPFGNLTNSVYYTIEWLTNIEWRKYVENNPEQVLTIIRNELKNMNYDNRNLGFVNMALAFYSYNQNDYINARTYCLNALPCNSDTLRNASLWRLTIKSILGRKLINMGRDLKRALATLNS